MIKASKVDEYRFIKILVDGNWEAYKALIELAEELNIKFSWDSLDPSAVAYTHFLSWLALNGTVGDIAVALIINLPVWGRNCLRLAAWARENGVRKIRFMELFSGPYEELEKLAEEIAQRYLDWPRYRFIAKTIQRYELDFCRAISI